MSQQHSLKQAAQQGSTEMTNNSDQRKNGPEERPKFGELTPYMTESERMYFSGLDDVSPYPASVESSSIAVDDPLTFNQIIQLLPEAQESTLKAVNPFVNSDGTVDVDDITSETGINSDDLSINPQNIQHETTDITLDDYKIIIDPTRARLNALDPRIKFWWNVTTDGSGRSYTIINPQDAYWPAYKTFKNKGKEDTIFGWVEKRDYGGEVDMFVLFEDQTIPHPEVDDEEIYIGFQTGYDFTGGRALDVVLFGYDPVNDVRMYSLGERRSRKHVGDPNDPENERQKGRTPIGDWWDEEYENLLQWTDELLKDIEKATATTIDFSEFDFTVEEFYEYLDIPKTYIEDTDGGRGAVSRAQRHSPSDNIYTMWSLYYALSTTLEKEFQGADHSSATYKVYADVATRILRNTREVILKAERIHKQELLKQQNKTQAAGQEVTRTRPEDIDSVNEISGVDTEDRLDLTTKREIAKNKQQKLFDEL